MRQAPNGSAAGAASTPMHAGTRAPHARAQPQARQAMDPQDRALLSEAEARAAADRLSPAVILCHSMPTNW